MDFDKEKRNLYKNKPFQFRKLPYFIKFFSFTNQINKTLTNNVNENNKISFGYTFKKLGFKFGNIISSFWFIIFLFYFQSYFLKQNLQKSDSKFISD